MDKTRLPKLGTGKPAEAAIRAAIESAPLGVTMRDISAAATVSMNAALAWTTALVAAKIVARVGYEGSCAQYPVRYCIAANVKDAEIAYARDKAAGMAAADRRRAAAKSIRFKAVWQRKKQRMQESLLNDEDDESGPPLNQRWLRAGEYHPLGRVGPSSVFDLAGA
jgi:hypothetical protein